MDTSFYTSAEDSIGKPQGALADIKYIVIDVDGTMTDAGIYYDENGNELKKFSTKDAAGFFTAKLCGIKIIVLTGRKCSATTRRMKELQVDYLEQEVVDKVTFLKSFMEEHQIEKKELAYIGDDLNDYEGMKLAAFVGCPADSADEIIAVSDYVSIKNGGDGAVRDVVSHLLKKRGQWDAAIKSSYKIGI